MNEYARPIGAPEFIERKENDAWDAKTLRYYFDTVTPEGDLIYTAQKKETRLSLLVPKEK